MSKVMFISVFVLVIVINTVELHETTFDYSKHKGMFEECLDPETNEYIIGATFQLPKRCLLGVCREDFTVGVSGCSNYYKTQLEEKKSHCIEIEGNNDALFPECCPKIQC